MTNKKIGRGDNQTHGKPDGSLTSMRRHTERHANDCKRYASERKRKTFVDFRAAGAPFPRFLAFQLLENCSIESAERLGRFFSFS